jgi:hypothetical protein
MSETSYEPWLLERSASISENVKDGCKRTRDRGKDRLLPLVVSMTIIDEPHY